MQAGCVDIGDRNLVQPHCYLLPIPIEGYTQVNKAVGFGIGPYMHLQATGAVNLWILYYYESQYASCSAL